MGIEFNRINKYILITSPTTELEALDIYNAAMDWADELDNMPYSTPMRAIGKAPLGGGVYTDSVFILQNGWKIKFWSGTYQALVRGTLITEDETPRTVPPDFGNVEVVFQVSSQGTVIPDEAEWTQTEKDGIISDVDIIQAKTDNIPSDLGDVPTEPELDSKHGFGSWEGATPSQVWDHTSRKLTSTELAGEDGHVAKEETVIEKSGDIKGTGFVKDEDSLTKIKDELNMRPTDAPKSKAQAWNQRNR